MRTKIIVLMACTAFAVCAADMTDFDGDGLPDLWETAFGISTNSAEGLAGADGDPDGDGLSNMAEYLAGYTVVGGNIYSNFTWAVSGLSPTNAYSLGTGVSDYYRKAVPSHGVSLGWMFSDRDFVDDAWESSGTNGASLFSFDGAAGDVVTNGSWTVWDRCRADYARRPVPLLSAKLAYRGPQALGTVRLLAFADLRTKPVAQYSLTQTDRRVAPALVSGALTPAARWWLALPNDGTFQTDYPVGACALNAVGWDAANIDMELMPATARSITYSLPAPSAGLVEMNKVRVRLVRNLVDGSSSYQAMVLDATYDFQNTLSLLDYVARGNPEMDYGLPGVSTALDRYEIVYSLYIGNNTVLTNNQLVLTATNHNDLVRFVAAPIAPLGGSFVFSVRPRIEWSAPESYTAFAYELRKGATNGPVVYQSPDLKAPPRDPDSGHFVYDLPIYSGDTMPGGVVFESGTNYFWRLAALNSRFTLAQTTAPYWSAWSGFRLSAARPPAGGGLSAIGATVWYSGAATNFTGRVKLQAFSDRSFSGAPAAQYTLAAADAILMTNGVSGATNLCLYGLARGLYSVRAFIDSNTNGIRDAWESWGYANMSGAAGVPRFDVRMVQSSAGPRPPTVTVMIQDCDTDNDFYPDAWEFERNPASLSFLTLTGPAAVWPNPVLAIP